MLRLALVGFGKWGRNYCAAVQASGIAALHTVVLRPDSPQRAAARAAGLEMVDDVQQLHGVDAAIVATHPSASPALCVQLMRQGLAVMVEKPAALSAAQARTIASASAQYGQTVLVNHQHLFAQAFEQLRARTLDQETLDIRAQGSNLGPFRDYSALWDYGPHDVAMCLALMQAPPVRVQGAMQRWGDGQRYQLQLEFDAPRRGQARITLGNGAAPKVRSLALGPLCYDDTDAQGQRLRAAGVAVTLPPWEAPLTRSVHAFASAVRAGGSDDYRFGAHWAVQVAEVLEGAEASAASAPSPRD